MSVLIVSVRPTSFQTLLMVVAFQFQFCAGFAEGFADDVCRELYKYDFYESLTFVISVLIVSVQCCSV